MCFPLPPMALLPRSDGATAGLSQAKCQGLSGTAHVLPIGAWWAGPPSWVQVPLDSLASTCTAASRCPKLHGNHELLVPEHRRLGVQTV